MSQNFPAEPLEVVPYGLLSLQDPTVDNEPHWVGGFYYESLACSTELNILDVCGGQDPINVVTPNRDFLTQFYQPFTLEAIDFCSTFGYKQHDVEARALAALEAGTQKGLEYEFWTGTAAQANAYVDNRYLASTSSVDVTPTPGTPVKIRYGLAMLERALAGCALGTKGTIHMTHDVASAMNSKVVGDHLESPVGNYIVAGSGYTGSGPDGTMPTTGQWMYATGNVTVRIGDSQILGDKMSQQVDRSVNTWEVHAERPAAVTWDGCCAFAVLVDLALEYI